MAAAASEDHATPLTPPPPSSRDNPDATRKRRRGADDADDGEAADSIGNEAPPPRLGGAWHAHLFPHTKHAFRFLPSEVGELVDGFARDPRTPRWPALTALAARFTEERSRILSASTTMQQQQTEFAEVKEGHIKRWFENRRRIAKRQQQGGGEQQDPSSTAQAPPSAATPPSRIAVMRHNTANTIEAAAIVDGDAPSCPNPVALKLKQMADGWKEFYDKEIRFESWAPRSSRAWRLRDMTSEVQVKGAQAGRAQKTYFGEGSLAEELARLDELERNGGADALAADAVATMTAEAPPPSEGESDRPSDLAVLFYNVDERTAACVARTREASFEMDSPISGEELADLCYSKYQRFHDMALKRDDFMGRKVSINLYVGFLGQRAFPYSEAEYLDKLDIIAAAVNTWGQCAYVRSFFQEKPIPRRGLPSRPRPDTAVSIRLYKSVTWDDSCLDGYFVSE